MLVVAMSLGVGLIPTFSERFFAAAPPALAPLTHSGVLLGIVTAIVLNLFLRAGRGRDERAAVQHDIDIHGLPATTSGNVGG
jgi:NCS2 family nucleobase:cation symporter-2